MSQPHADFLVEAQPAGAALVTVTGALTNAAEADLMAVVGEVTAQGIHTMILDFSQITYINSTGIGLLVTLLVRANRLNLHLAACGLNEHYREIFALTRLEEAFSVFATREEALAAV